MFASATSNVWFANLCHNSFHSLAIRWKLAPGNHSGIYLSNGKTSTRNLPGIAPAALAAIASSAR